MFKNFKEAVQVQMQMMVAQSSHLFLTDVDKDVLWNTYLESFPEGTNSIYKVRREYDCSCCRQFIRPIGNLVAIIDGKLVSIWDITVEEPYQQVADTLSQLVKSQPIINLFVSKEKRIGTYQSHESINDVVKTWDHFSFVVPDSLVNKTSHSIEALQGQFRDKRNILKRALDEISLDAVDTVLELINSNSIYRGEEHKYNVEQFQALKRLYIIRKDKDLWTWFITTEVHDALAKIGNSSIGTLLYNISEGMELDVAVAKFEQIMAPANYKRPNAVITQSMIKAAQATIESMGLMNSLGRRYATVDDLTINNVLFVNRNINSITDVFGELQSEVKTSPKDYSKLEEVTIESFINNILPTTTDIEVLLENKHTNSFMSVIAPQDKEAPSLFKWKNAFSWAYNGDMTDTIKERVKAAGGRVEGELRASLSWFNYDDLDIHVIEPSGNRIYFGEKRSHTSGTLDVDMNAGGGSSKTPVENIIWTDKTKMRNGKYIIYINNYTKRETVDVGFTVELEHNGKILTYNYDKAVRDGESVSVVTFEYSKLNGITIIESLPSTETSKEIWNINTNQFHKVSMMLNSPNHWDGESVGNKHYFFIIDQVVNPTTPRGFFNEFLKEELLQQKRVFEALGSKMKVEPSNTQLSGLGFSSTNKDSIVVRVKGSTNRLIKIKF